MQVSLVVLLQVVDAVGRDLQTRVVVPGDELPLDQYQIVNSMCSRGRQSGFPDLLNRFAGDNIAALRIQCFEQGEPDHLFDLEIVLRLCQALTRRHRS